MGLANLLGLSFDSIMGKEIGQIGRYVQRDGMTQMLTENVKQPRLGAENWQTMVKRQPMSGVNVGRKLTCSSFTASVRSRDGESGSFHSLSRVQMQPVAMVSDGLDSRV